MTAFFVLQSATYHVDLLAQGSVCEVTWIFCKSCNGHGEVLSDYEMFVYRLSSQTDFFAV